MRRRLPGKRILPDGGFVIAFCTSFAVTSVALLLGAEHDGIARIAPIDPPSLHRPRVVKGNDPGYEIAALVLLGANGAEDMPPEEDAWDHEPLDIGPVPDALPNGVASRAADVLDRAQATAPAWSETASLRPAPPITLAPIIACYASSPRAVGVAREPTRRPGVTEIVEH